MVYKSLEEVLGLALMLLTSSRLVIIVVQGQLVGGQPQHVL